MSILTQSTVHHRRWFTNWQAAVTRWKVDRAIVHAAVEVGRAYPIWNEMLFDTHFLLERGRPVIERNLHTPTSTDAFDLALTWVEQWPRMSAERRKAHVQAVTPVAASFLCRVRHKLGSTNESSSANC